MKMAGQHGAYRARAGREEEEENAERERERGRQGKHHQDIRPGAICASNFLFLHKQTS